MNFKNCSIGIELGSTRIKSVLIDEKGSTLATGGYGWENKLVDNIWTYSIDEIWEGIQVAYTELRENIEQKYSCDFTTVGAIGFSGMMHGYMAFDKDDNLLVPFRTWRNNLQGAASKELTELFNYPVPQRWTIAHLRQAILNEQEHVGKIDFLSTLASYVHYKLTGEKVIGVGEASGVFPIDLETKSYNGKMVGQFKELTNINLTDIFPKVLVAGENAGHLTPTGAKLLDVSGKLESGIPLCPPEGDAGTGMVATNSVKKRTANVSAGTSVFAMIVLEKALSKVYSEIDEVTTPSGDLVAMVHCNNCTSDLNAWVNLFGEVLGEFGVTPDNDELFGKLYRKALEGDKDCGGLLAYPYLSGEHSTGFEEGRPLFVRNADSKFNLANFMLTNLCTSLGALNIGLKILFENEGVEIDEMLGHGGLFKTAGVGDTIMARATNTPVTTMATASEGGAWGIALLAQFMLNDFDDLSEYLETKIFSDIEKVMVEPEKEGIEGFDSFMKRYVGGLDIEHAAVANLKS